MSQSWDNVANIYKLFTVGSHTQRNLSPYFTVSSHAQRNYLPSCMPTISTVCMQQHELWSYYFIDHTPRCRLLELTTAMVTSEQSENIETKNTPHLSLRSRLGGAWPAEQASRNGQRFVPFVQEWISMATLVCAHSNAILTNCGPSDSAPKYTDLSLNSDHKYWQNFKNTENWENLVHTS